MVTQDARERVVSYINHQAQKSNDAIVDLVRRNQLRLLDVMERIDDEQAARKPAPDEWNIRELLSHVITSELGVARLVQALARGERPASEPVLGVTGEHSARMPDLVQRLREANEALVQAIAGLPDQPDLDTRSPHPFFGDLNCKEWAVFQRVHDEDHIRHAGKILSAVAAES